MFGSLLIESLLGNGKGRGAPSAGESGLAPEGDAAFHATLAEETGTGTGAGPAAADVASVQVEAVVAGAGGSGESRGMAGQHALVFAFDTTAAAADRPEGAPLVAGLDTSGAATVDRAPVRSEAPVTRVSGPVAQQATAAEGIAAPLPAGAETRPSRPAGDGQGIVPAASVPTARPTGETTRQPPATGQAPAAADPRTTATDPATPARSGIADPAAAVATSGAVAGNAATGTAAPSRMAPTAPGAAPPAAARPAATEPAGWDLRRPQPDAGGIPAGTAPVTQAPRIAEAAGRTGTAAATVEPLGKVDATQPTAMQAAAPADGRTLEPGPAPAEARPALAEARQGAPIAATPRRSGTEPPAMQGVGRTEAQAGPVAPAATEPVRTDQAGPARMTGERPAIPVAETATGPVPRAPAGPAEGAATAAQAGMPPRGQPPAPAPVAGLLDTAPTRPGPDLPARTEPAPATGPVPAQPATPAATPAATQPALAFAAATERQQPMQRGTERSSPRAERMEALATPTSQGAAATATAATATAQTVAPPAGMAFAPAQPGMALTGERGQDRWVPGGDTGAESTLIGGSDRAGGALTGIERAAQQVATSLSDLPRGVGLQLAEAASRFPDRPVELTLSPEELGRVRMTLSTADGALTLSLSAERPETLELLRRHIDELARDFRALGYADVSFSFQDQPAGRDPSDGDRAEPGDGDAADPARPDTAGKPAPESVRLALAPGQGLDLRF